MENEHLRHEITKKVSLKRNECLKHAQVPDSLVFCLFVVAQFVAPCGPEITLVARILAVHFLGVVDRGAGRGWGRRRHHRRRRRPLRYNGYNGQLDTDGDDGGGGRGRSRHRLLLGYHQHGLAHLNHGGLEGLVDDLFLVDGGSVGGEVGGRVVGRLDGLKIKLGHPKKRADRKVCEL